MIWRDVPGYEHSYEVSDTGLVRNWSTWRVLRPRKCKDGSYLVNLTTNGIKQTFILHRLVALAFVPNPDDLPFVRHKDGDKDNYQASNLYWSGTRQKTKEKVEI